MRGGRKVSFVSAPAAAVTETAGSVQSWEGVDRDLFEHLRGIRRELADRDGVPAFVIFGDNTLRDLARRRPTNAAALRQVFGIGEAKRAKFGDRFVSEIASFCQKHGLSTNVASGGLGPGDESDEFTRGAKSQRPVPAKPSPAKRQAFVLFSNEESVERVAAALDRSPKTVAGYLCEYVAARGPESVQSWIDPATYQKVADAAGVVGTERLKPIFEKLDGQVPYESIRLVVTHLASK